MINETQPTTESSSIAFGIRLQTLREALGLSISDVAARLRLNEKVILMMEKGHYPDDLPVIFICGYIRAYSKLLQVPEAEVKAALEPIKNRPIPPEASTTESASKPSKPITSHNYSMQISTYFIAFTLMGLVGAWWYSNNSGKDALSPILAEENKLLSTPSDTIQQTIPPLAMNTNNATPTAGTSEKTVLAAQTPTGSANPSGATQENTAAQTTATDSKATTSTPAGTKQAAKASDDDDDDDDDDDYND